MKSLSCLIDLTSYQTFKTTLNTKHETLTDKYMLTMKLLWSAKKITKVKNSEDIPHQGNIEVVLVTFNIVSDQ